MGAGIAVAFKEKFGGLEELRRQRINVGGVGVLRRDGRYIYYLVTKERYSDKPSLKSLEASLVALRERITADGVQRLAMPKLGCGLDGLSWNLVQELVSSVFRQTPVEIQVRGLYGLSVAPVEIQARALPAAGSPHAQHPLRALNGYTPRGCASSQVTHSRAFLMSDLARLRPSSRLVLPRRRSN